MGGNFVSKGSSKKSSVSSLDKSNDKNTDMIDDFLGKALKFAQIVNMFIK